MVNNQQFLETQPAPTMWSRVELIFAAAVAATLVGVIAPTPELALDVLWACVLSLTIAVGVIFPAAASTADLKGFAALLTGPALLRIGLVGATMGKLLGGQTGGLLIPATGKFLTGGWPLAAALVGLAVAAGLLVVLFGACQKITAACRRYRKRIYPLKTVGLRTDLKMNVVSAGQAELLAEKVNAEARLFSNLSGASLLMRVEGAFEIAAAMICLIWPFFGVASAGGSSAERMAQAATTAVGLIVFSLLPATASALAGAYLAGKDSLTLRIAPDRREPTGRTFTLVDKETGRCEEVELLNPEFAGRANTADAAERRERIAEFEPTNSTTTIETLTFSTDTPQGYYRHLAAAVADAAGATRIVLFAAGQVRHLPVTVFVNTAIQLVQQGQKVLLVDADRQRHALAQVFDADAERLRKEICASGFEGLDLFGTGDAPHATQATLKDAAGAYSCILVYAPDAETWSDLEAVLGTLEPTAFVFDPDAATEQADMLTTALHYCRQIMAAPTSPVQPETR